MPAPSKPSGADPGPPPRAVAVVAWNEDGFGEGQASVVDWLSYDGRPEHLWRELMDRGIPSHVAVDVVMQISQSVPPSSIREGHAVGTPAITA
jgi:hypothetical protein